METISICVNKKICSGWWEDLRMAIVGEAADIKAIDKAIRRRWRYRGIWRPADHQPTPGPRYGLAMYVEGRVYGLAFFEDRYGDLEYITLNASDCVRLLAEI